MLRMSFTVCMLFGFSAVFMHAADPETGLAQKYLMDEDIASDPAVIFHEDFEDDKLKQRGWYDLAGWTNTLLVSDEDKATGDKSLKLVYPKGKTGPWCRAPHFKQGHETIYVRYYRKWADGWNWGGEGDGNGHDTRLVSANPGLGKQAYKNDDMSVLMMESCTHFDPWKRGLFGLMLFQKKNHLFTPAVKQSHLSKKADGHALRGKEWWLATVDKSRSPKSQVGKWYCVEYMATMNTPGQEDGVIKGWIDGVLYYHVDKVMMRDKQSTQEKWKRWWIGPYFHGGTTKDQHSYIDSIVIANNYIGPMKTTAKR